MEENYQSRVQTVMILHELSILKNALRCIRLRQRLSQQCVHKRRPPLAFLLPVLEV